MPFVVGDVFRRFVGRTAQVFAPQFQRACFPHQNKLSTRAGTEALTRVLAATGELNPRATHGQGEGGEQGDPLMPALHAIAQQPALHDVQAAFREGLDDTYAVVAPERVRELYSVTAPRHWGHVRGLNSTSKNRAFGMRPAKPRDVADLQKEGAMRSRSGIGWSFHSGKASLFWAP